MRSIRLSLILCFLVLLLAALGVVSLLVYQSAEGSLKEKQVSMRHLLLASYNERCQKEQSKLDEMLRADANNLAGVLKLQVQWLNPKLQPLLSLGMLSAATSPQGHLQMPFWLAQGSSKNAIGFRVSMLGPWLKLKDMTLPPNFEPQVAEFFQINTLSGDHWQSPSMEGLSFDFDPNIFGSAGPLPKVVDWAFDDLEVEGLGKLRRVQLKLTRFRVSFPTPPALKWPNARLGPPGKAGDKNKPKPEAPRPTTEPGKPADPPKPNAPPELTVFVQSASSTESRDTNLARFRTEHHKDLLNLEAESQTSLELLKNRLLVVAGIAFGLTVIGGCLLVGTSLKPLRRLTQAVSQVSEKDFRLPLESKSLPGELRPIADCLQQTLVALQRAFAREKQAAADISHELRTPLAALMTMLEVGLRKPRAAEQYRELLQDCHSTGQQMVQLVERMLALARLDAGSVHLRPSEIDVNHLAQQCTTLVRPLAEARGLTLRCQPGDNARMTADPDKLREVLTNLLHNAIEYNKPNGSIVVKVARENGHLQVEVCDTGVGIPTDAREHIFERFYRADSSRHTDSERLHAGIGLAIVKGYIEMMGGRISVDSEVGVGSTFRVKLPVK